MPESSLPAPPPPAPLPAPAQEYAAYLRELMKKSIAHPTNPDAPLTGFKIGGRAGLGADRGGAGLGSQQQWERTPQPHASAHAGLACLQAG